MIRPLKYHEDRNFYIFFDVETSPIYFIQRNNEKIEQSTVISLEAYNNYKLKNEKLKEIKYNIGFYQVTKMISIFDENNASQCLILDDKNLISDLEFVKNEEYTTELYFAYSQEELIDLFWEVINQYMEDNLNVRCFAHNIGFDLKQIDFFTRVKGKQVTSCCLQKPFFIKIKYDEESYLSFDDSYSFFSRSLKSLGKGIGIPKLDFKFNGNELIIDDKCIEYCIRDTYIIKEAICRLKQYLEDKELGNLGVTISGTSMNIWRTSFLEYPINNDYTEALKDFIVKIERKCYSGGRNECMKIGLFENIYYFDINSLYPYTMESNKFPIKFACLIDDKYEDFNNSYINELLENEDNYYIFNCQIDTVKNHIPYRDERLLFIKGKWEGWIHLPEFKYFFKRNEVKKVTSVLVYKSDYIFKDYISFFKKEKIKNDDNPTYREIDKLLQNCLYGKTAEHLRESNFIEHDEPIIESVDVVDENGLKICRRDSFGYFTCENISNIDANAKTAFPCIAGAVTSYARLELIKMIDRLGLDNVLYYDTDSIMSKIAIPKKFIHDYNYGKWKNEAHKIYNKNKLPQKDTLSVIIKGCKNYILFDGDKILSIKSKGIKKDSKEIDDDFYSSNKWWSVLTTKVKKETLFTLKHTVIMHELKKNTLKYLKGKTIFKGSSTKKLDGINIKYNTRDIEPWNLNDIIKLEKEE